MGNRGCGIERKREREKSRGVRNRERRGKMGQGIERKREKWGTGEKE